MSEFDGDSPSDGIADFTFLSMPVVPQFDGDHHLMFL